MIFFILFFIKHWLFDIYDKEYIQTHIRFKSTYSPCSPKVNNRVKQNNDRKMSGFRILVGCKRVIDYAVKVSSSEFYYALLRSFKDWYYRSSVHVSRVLIFVVNFLERCVVSIRISSFFIKFASEFIIRFVWSQIRLELWLKGLNTAWIHLMKLLWRKQFEWRRKN